MSASGDTSGPRTPESAGNHAPTLPPGVAPELLDEGGHVAADRACVGCGYNLRTLPATGHCPECGHPIADSVRPLSFIDADRDWLTSLSSGAAVLTIVFISTTVFVAVGAGLTLLAPSLRSIAYNQCTISALAAFWPLLTFLGLNMLTAPDPREQPHERRQQLRRAIRRTMLVVVFALGAVFIGVSFEQSALWIVTGAVLCVGAALLLYWTALYVARLLERDDHRVGSSLARKTAVASLVVALLGAALIATQVLVVHARLPGAAALPLLLAAVLCGVHGRMYWRLWQACRAAAHERDADSVEGDDDEDEIGNGDQGVDQAIVDECPDD